MKFINCAKLAILASPLFLPAIGHAGEPGINNWCITNIPSGLAPRGQFQPVMRAGFPDSAEFMSGGMCQSLSGFRSGLKVFNIILDSAAVGAAMGIVTIPAEIDIGPALAFTDAVQVTFDLICDSEGNAPSKEQIQEYVCAQMESKGVVCDPNITIQTK